MNDKNTLNAYVELMRQVSDEFYAVRMRQMERINPDSVDGRHVALLYGLPILLVPEACLKYGKPTILGGTFLLSKIQFDVIAGTLGMQKGEKGETSNDR